MSTQPSRDATIYDVAARAGVSISTVSLSINRPGRVGTDTRRRIRDAIDDLGFVPKAAAVIHARQGIARVGVVAPFTTYPSYAHRLNGMLAALRSDEVDVVVYDEESAASSATPLQSALPLRRSLEGLVIMGLPVSDDAAGRLTRHRLPTVLVDSVRPEFTSITSDDEYGGWLAGRHLIDRGHREIAFVSEAQRSKAYVSQGQRRLAGLRRAAAEAGGDVRVTWAKVTNDVEGGRDGVRRILARRGRRVTAIFAHHDLLGAGALLELRRHGLRAPDDVAVVGFDDSEIAAATGLTSIRQPLEESGRVAAQVLRALFAAPDSPCQQITLALELVVRDST